MENNFVPEVCLMIYKQKKENNQDTFYLETRKVRKTKLGYRILEGKPLDKKTHSELSKYFKKSKEDSIYCKGLLPKNVLYFGESNSKPHIIWYRKGPASLIFKKDLNVKDGIYMLPTLIFMLKGETLSVFATKSKSINEKSDLYKAPFHNIYDNGDVCMGSALIKESNELKTIIKNYESAFFNSKFSHFQNEGSPIKGNLNTYFNKIVDKQIPFDNSLLIKTNKKLKNLTE